MGALDIFAYIATGVGVLFAIYLCALWTVGVIRSNRKRRENLIAQQIENRVEQKLENAVQQQAERLYSEHARVQAEIIATNRDAWKAFQEMAIAARNQAYLEQRK